MNSPLRRVSSFALVIALFAPQLAAAQAAPPAAAPATVTPAQEASNRAREAFQKANVHYALGEFALAAELYQDAYKLKPDAALLYNAAQSFRLAGNAPRALVLYKNYLLFYPAQRNAPEVKQQVINLQNAIATAEKAQTAPPTNTAQPREPDPVRPATTPRTEPTVSAPGVVATTPAPTTTITAPAPTPGTVAAPAPTPAVTTPAPTQRAEHRPVYKKWWFWVATVGGVVVVGGAVTAGVLLGRRNDATPWATTPSFGSGAKGLNVSQLGVSW